MRTRPFSVRCPGARALIAGLFLLAGQLATAQAPAGPAMVGGPARTPTVPPAPSLALPAAAIAPVLAHYAVLVQASYQDTLQLTRVLRQAVQAFVASPSVGRLSSARRAWLAARERYTLTEAFRFYGGPIDGAKGPEPRINSWPVDESFIDGIVGRPGAGLVNDPGFTIERKTLAAVNVRDGEENVATGWHAIEFLLRGQDLSADGPGDRPFTDYVRGKSPHADRRGRYLLVATDLLVDDLASVLQAWAPGAANYRREFEQGGSTSLRRIIVGLGMLSRAELAGERLEVALASQDQEDEHSCFSDNTHRDIVGNARGIENVWLGRYTRLDGRTFAGPSLQQLVGSRDAALADRLSRQMAQSVASAEAIVPPFDREIVGAADAPGRLRVRRVVDSLVLQAAGLIETARVLGLRQLNWAPGS